MGIGLSVGVAMSVGLAMLRLLQESLFYILLFQVIYLPLCLHLLCLIFLHQLHLIGAVASGPLAATFMLPLAIGAAEAKGGNVYTDAFGIVALLP